MNYDNKFPLDNRGDKDKKCKFDFKTKKDNTLHSLKEVECFLCNLKKACKGIHLYKFLK